VIVMKFGGTSVADAERIRAVAGVLGRIPRRPVVVVSALAGVTNLLDEAFAAAKADDLERLEPLLADIERRHRWALAGAVDDARQRHDLGLEIDRLFEELRERLRSLRILGEGTPRVRDAVLACGESLSARIVAAAFRGYGLPARWVDPAQVMLTDGRFGAAAPDAEGVRERCDACLVPLVEAGELPVLGGFVGATAEGQTTTLGRGGSDTSAAILALALAAQELEIWTDVDGLMSADPGLVPGARTLETLSFAEAAELALYGARVLHPDSIAPAVRRNIPVRILNSLRPERRGTLVLAERREPGAQGAPLAVATKQGMGLARLTSRRMPMEPALARRALELCATAGVVPEILLSSATTVTLVATGIDGLAALHVLEDQADVEVLPECAIVCLVGGAVANVARLRATVLAELATGEPELIATGAFRASIVAVVRQRELATLVRRLHDVFFEGGTKP